MAAERYMIGGYVTIVPRDGYAGRPILGQATDGRLAGVAGGARVTIVDIVNDRPLPELRVTGRSRHRRIKRGLGLDVARDQARNHIETASDAAGRGRGHEVDEPIESLD